jgi:LmbE family N-acetylglucosaminyl deacetylase
MQPLIEAIDGASNLIVLSPHLDDAVLSCGALMSHARKQMCVTVVTFFTEGGPPPYSHSARSYLRETRNNRASGLFLARRAEDQAVLESAGISYVHVGLTEALFRRRTRPSLNRLPWAGRLVPELCYNYPTYRLHVIRGGISPDDTSTIRSIHDTIDCLSLKSSTLFLAPLAVGRHIDHLLVRTAAELSGKRLAYYSDFPYNIRYPVDLSFVQRNSLSQATWSDDLAAKQPLIRAYRTQADSLFPGGEIPVAPEVYLLPGQRELRTPANRLSRKFDPAGLLIVSTFPTERSATVLVAGKHHDSRHDPRRSPRPEPRRTCASSNAASVQRRPGRLTAASRMTAALDDLISSLAR